MTRLIVNPNLVLREEGAEGAILYDPDSGAVRFLNRTATAIYKLVDGKRTALDITNVLKRRFGQFEAEGEKQVAEFLSDLLRAGIVAEV